MSVVGYSGSRDLEDRVDHKFIYAVHVYMYVYTYIYIIVFRLIGREEGSE